MLMCRVLTLAKSAYDWIHGVQLRGTTQGDESPGHVMGKTMERSTMFNGKTHYFYGHVQ
jgi:hypothetical protein